MESRAKSIVSFRKKYSEEDQEQKVLEWINERRVSKGLDPIDRIPRGEKASYTTCPVAKGLEAEKEKTYIAAWGLIEKSSEPLSEMLTLGRPWDSIPDYVAYFIREFDKGRRFKQYNVKA